MCVQLPRSFHTVLIKWKGPFEAAKVPLVGLQSASKGKKWQKDEVSEIKRCISSAFISGVSGIFDILFTSEPIGRGLYAHTNLQAQLWNPNIKTVHSSFLDSWLKWYKAISCPWLGRCWLLLCMEKYVYLSLSQTPLLWLCFWVGFLWNKTNMEKVNYPVMWISNGWFRIHSRWHRKSRS